MSKSKEVALDRPNKFSHVQYPSDRRHIIRVKPSFVFAAVVLLLIPLILGWIYCFLWGLPALDSVQSFESDAIGFPLWIRLAHFVNFLFLILLIRSGLQILMDHPRLYWNIHCTPGTEWIRFTPFAAPLKKSWTARDDARFLSPWIGLPGYRHTIGVARHWHFISVLFWLLNGLAFLVLLFSTPYWKRLIPHDLKLFKDAAIVFLHYITLHLPQEPNGFYTFNPLQQIAYFYVIFILAPLMLFTGLAMSPAIDNRFKWYQRLFGNKQIARSIHFLGLLSYVGFLIIHVSMVVITGFVQNMNHIVLGTDHLYSTMGAIIGVIAILFVVFVCVLAHHASWLAARKVQHFSDWLLGPIYRVVLGSFKPCVNYSEKDISPYHWKNGALPTRTDWVQMGKNNFSDFRLKVHGLVENPMEFSLEDLRALAKKSQTVLHHCIQGWTGIAQWGGIPLSEVIGCVRPKAEAKCVIFWSFGEGLEGGPYYDSHSLEEAMQEQTLLAYEMNHLPLLEDYGAPLRLRIENKLGFKMVKWIESIEFVETFRDTGKGEGGKCEDDEYFGYSAEI